MYRLTLKAYLPLTSVNLLIIIPLSNALQIIKFFTSHAE